MFSTWTRSHRVCTQSEKNGVIEFSFSLNFFTLQLCVTLPVPNLPPTSKVWTVALIGL